MDVSLDEIIKRNKISNLTNRRRRRPGGQNDKKSGGGGEDGLKTRKGGGRRSGSGRGGGGGGRRSTTSAAAGGGSLKQQSGGVKKKKVTDLRSLIASRAAASVAPPSLVMRDAREKISKTPRLSDAREKLLSRSAANINTQLLMRRNRRNSVNIRRKLDSRKPAYMDLEEARLKRRSSAGGSLLYRTVDNDAGYLRDLRTECGGVGLGLVHPLHPLVSINRPSAVAASAAIAPLMPDSWMQPTIQDITRFQPVTRTFNQDDMWTQPQVPRRSANGLKRRLEREEEVSQMQGYRIVVSNLQPTVTHEDIKELFEDIGTLYNSCVVRPGTAEVMYKSMEDAVKAVDTYHNRQLDGQPMKCLLVKPSNMSRIHSKGSVVPDLHAIHKALFNK